jgi:uncharacterized protein
MSIEVRPLNVLCNIQCQYCYQHPQRDTGNVPHTYDLPKMKSAIEAEGGPFTLFGGEPLLLPLRDLEDLWSWGHERYGKNSLQTNGVLISDEHIELFRKYKVHVGISVDGPDELNDARWHGSLERTRESTRKTQSAIEKLCREGPRPSLIVTLHRINASREKVPRLTEWVRYLHGLGVEYFRLHLLESESPIIRAKFGLTVSENVDALVTFMKLSREVPTLKFDLFSEMRRLLKGEDRRNSCVWSACDPYTTRAVRGIEGQGQRSNCGRTNKDGIDFVKTSSQGFERYLALYHTPQDVGGCKDCRFFLMCKGQCPGTALDGDWRNRTEHCEVWKALFEILEEQITSEAEIPLSLSPQRKEIETRALERWAKGRDVCIAHLLGLPPLSGGKNHGSNIAVATRI